ncbi:jg20490 [Pararge aegeria aegeria]|uniref:Jg20490 protein n=1 Tax=Pararge aegeria aegeria TaxID=348720 RepID=A0A8S4RSP0_9NEOP|nr:jg20490 [Pararge aegeria aegeria]
MDGVPRSWSGDLEPVNTALVDLRRGIQMTPNELLGAAGLERHETMGAKPVGGDLMADLHAKLSMRRRGISGAERSGGTLLHTLASVIPEPTESSPQQSSSGEDWE